MKDSRRYMLYTTLEILEKEVAPSQFFRISPQFILPFGSIYSIIQLFNNQLKTI